MHGRPSVDNATQGPKLGILSARRYCVFPAVKSAIWS
jgi:hypothetical protein